MLNESLLTTTPYSCGPAIAPLHYMRKLMARHLDHLQEEEGGHVAAGSFQLCHRTGHRPVVWQWGPAWQSHSWPMPGHETEQASKSSSCARIIHLWQWHQILVRPRTVSPHEKEAGTETPGWLSKRLHYPSWMQEQAMLVYPVDDIPAFIFLQTCLLSWESL